MREGIMSKSLLTSTPVLINNSNMDPWFVTGLIDAEGCFTIKIGER